MGSNANIANAIDVDTQRITTLVSRNVTVLGRRTSIRLEPEMWLALREISTREHCRIHDICTLVSVRKKPGTSLTAAIRVFLMLYFRASSTEEGHLRAGHGDFENMLQRARLPEQGIPGFERRRTPFYGNGRNEFQKKNDAVAV